MHLSPPGSDSVLVLNSGGLHFFTNSSLLNNLASVLLRASNAANDESVRNFFTSYGYAEGCAMCFALVTSSSSSSSLRSKATLAALSHAHTPSMSLIGTGDGRDPLSGYKFQPSSLYDGLVKFASRLVRPFWHKVAVIVTEGKPIQSKHSLYSNYYAAVPAKVELLLDDVTLDEVRRPLMLLVEMMKKTFTRIVDSVPGASKTHSDAMDVDDDLNAGGLITRALQNQSRAAQKGNTNQPHDLTQDELRKIACQKEDRNMHSLYRLWSRCIQMFDLITCLKNAHSSPALPDVQWGLLHGLTYCQLVTTFEGQQRVETLLNALFSQSDNNLVSDLSIEGDSLASMLSRSCYLYFSPASRLTYLGFKAARDAQARSTVSNQRELLSNKAAVRPSPFNKSLFFVRELKIHRFSLSPLQSHLRAAARHWHDPDLVVGRSAAKSTSDSWRDVAQSAIESESPLALAAEELLKLRNAHGAADVCLICAANFGGAKVPIDDRRELGEMPIEGMFDWERGLYQQPPTEKPSDGTTGQSAATGSQSIVISGIQATPADALKTCHSVLFHHIFKLLAEGGEENQSLAVELLGVCASSSDVKFLHSLYEQLVVTHNSDTLLRIDSSTLEEWLKKKSDANLLFKYYSFHGRNVQAGDLMYNMALDEDITNKFPLSTRMEYLTRSANAFSAAIQTSSPNEQVSVPELKNTLTHIHEKLEVAAIQQSVLTIVQQSQNTNLDEEKMNALSYSLVKVSDIYNDYAAPLNLFDICLMIMETCRQNDSLNIATLWTSILCEELLPCMTNSQTAFEFLSGLKDSSIIQDDIIFGDGADATLMQFDNGSWIPRLKARVTELGKTLYGKGADYTFPLDLLLQQLEGLRQAQTQASNNINVPHNWPAQVMLDVGVPYYTILATYESFRVHNVFIDSTP
jgi:nuclear pore complex protein Nup155